LAIPSVSELDHVVAAARIETSTEIGVNVRLTNQTDKQLCLSLVSVVPYLPGGGRAVDAFANGSIGSAMLNPDLMFILPPGEAFEQSYPYILLEPDKIELEVLSGDPDEVRTVVDQFRAQARRGGFTFRSSVTAARCDTIPESRLNILNGLAAVPYDPRVFRRSFRSAASSEILVP
jgi:hypothetical protein